MSGDYPPCPACIEEQHPLCRRGLCGCLEDHEDDPPILRGFKRIKRAHPWPQTEEPRNYTSTVHIGVWRHPDGHREYMSAVTQPRQGEKPELVGFDKTRASWPYR